MSEYIPKYPSQEGDDSNKSSSELLAETLKPIYVPQDLMLAWETHLASYSRDTHVLLDQVKDSETALNTQYQALLTRVQKYEQMLQDITMDSNEFTIDDDEVNFTGWNILAQASYWDYLLRKEITKLSGQIKSAEYKGELVTEVTDAVLEGLIADNNYISNVIGALSDTPLIRELDAALTSTTTSLAELQADYVRLAEKQAADAEALAHQQVENAEQLVESINTAVAEQLDRIAQEAAVRTQLLQEIEVRTHEIEQEALERSEAISEHLGVVIGEVTQNVGAITERINSEVAVRNQMIADQSKALVLESEARAVAISTQADALAAESLARRNAITAQAEAINLEVTNRTKALKDQQEALSSKILSTNESTLAAIETRAVTLAADYNNKVTNLNNQLTVNIKNLESGVTTRLNSLDNEDGKLLQNIEAYKTSNNGNVAAIRKDLTTLNTAYGTTASKVEGLVTSFSGLDGKVSKNTTSIASEVTARSNADSALGIRIDNLTASTSGKFTEVNSSITNVSKAVTSLEQATATRFTGLDSSISGVDDKANTAINNAASAQNTANTAVTTNTAQAQEISKLQGRLDTTEGDLLTKASADVVSGILTDVSNIEGKLAVQASSIEDLNASLQLVDAKAGTANTAAANAQTTANTAVTNNTVTANRVNTLESNMTQVQGDLATKATASALELTNTEVTRLGGLTQTHSSSITDLGNNLVTTNNNVTKALNAITIAETPTNQLPSWYWANHPMRIVNEVKTASVIGVTGLDTKVNLETRIYSTTQANGPIVQRVISATDPTLEMVRRSTSATAWSAWTQPLKAIKDDVATKASSAALSSLDSKVTDIDGRVTSQATSLSELVADLTETNNLLGTVKSTAASALDTANAAVSANDAQATDITQLQAKMATAEGTLSRKADANALSSLETKVDNNQTATATRIDQLTAAITDLGEGVETAVDTHAFNALKAEVNTAKGNIASNTSAITDLGNSLNTLDNTVHGIEQKTTANANAIQDTSTKVSNIQGQVTSQGTSITNLRSDLTTAQNTANNATSLASTKADATAFNALDTKVTRIDGQVSSQASDITEIKADITDLDGKVNTKADSSALSSLTTKVGQVDGKVTTNANAITTLGGRVSTVEGKVATKAEASALSDYYTKTQADNKASEIAAGKVEQFSAGLVIGGTNLQKNSHFERNSVNDWSSVYGTHKVQDSLYIKTITSVASASRIEKYIEAGKVELGETYTLSILVQSDVDLLWNSFDKATRVKYKNAVAGDKFNVAYATFIPTAFPVIIRAYCPNAPVGSVIQIDWEKLEKGNVVTDWSESPEDIQEALDANSTAIQNTNAEVSRVDGRVTATNSAQTLLEGRVQTVEGEVTKKADASALTSLSTRVDTEEGKSLSQGNAITTLQNAVNHATTGLASKASSSAVTAVDNKVTAANGRIDTTNSNVATLTGRVSTVEGAVSTKAEASALTALTTRVSNAEGVNTSQGSAITTLENSVNHATTGLTSKASSAALTSVDNKVTAANGRIDTTNSNVTTLSGRVSTVEGDVAKKADASAVTALTTRVGNAEGVNTSQGSAITSLQNSVNHATTGLATKASTSALTATNSEVSRVNGLVTGHANQLTQLASDITTINGTLETKANATALNDIYTKSQADTKATEIAAGEVSKYDASLVIGGVNLLRTAELTNGDALTRLASTHTFVDDPTCPSGNTNVTKVTTNGGTGGIYVNSGDASNNNKDEVFTASVWLKGERGGERVYITEGHTPIPAGSHTFILTTSWKRYSCQLKRTNDTTFNFVVYCTSGIGSIFYASRMQYEKGTKMSAWSHPQQVLNDAVNANATAITNTNTEVARVDGRVTTESNRTTTLTGRVSTVEGNISKKADASALSSLDTRVGSVEGKYTSQASDITRLNNSLDTTNVNVGTAQTAAQNAMNAAGAKGKVIFGTTVPAVADRLIQNLWIDTTGNANTPKRWDGSAWVVVTDKVATDAAKAVSDLDNVVKTKADVSALNSLTTKVNNEADKTTANTNSITTLNSDIVKINNNLATKANASALNDIYTKQQTDAKATEVAAGEITKYDAKLQIGGVNLVTDSNNISQGNNGSTYIVHYVKGNPNKFVNVSNNGGISTYTAKFYQAVIGKTYTVSVKVRPDMDTELSLYAITSTNGSFVSKSGTFCPANVWTTLWYTFVAKVESVRLAGFLTSSGFTDNVTVEYKEYQAEEGTKVTTWSPANEDIQGALDANSTAIENTNAEVKRVDGRVTTNSTHITTLQGKVTTVENGLATKADGSALSALTTRVSNAEGGLSSQSSKVTKLEAGVGNTSTYVISTSRNGGFRAGGLPWGLYNSTLTRLAAFSRGFNLVVWANDGSYSSVQMFDTYGSSANVASLATALLALPVNTYFTLVGTDNLGTSAALQGNAELKNFVIANGGSASYYSTWGGNNLPIFTSMVGTGTGTGIQHSFNSNITNDWIKYPISLISGIPEGFAGVQPIDESKFATASALSTLDSKVTSIDGKVTTNSTSITNLSGKITAVENGLATKADGSALSSLATRVSNAEGGISTQSTALTKLSASLQSQGANLQQDGGFETLTATSGAMSAFTADKYSGSQCLKFARVAPTGSGGNNDVYWGDFFDVAGGRTYYVEAYVRRDPNETVTPNANTYFTLGINVLLKVTGAYNWLAAKYVKLAELSNTWSKVSGYITVPNNYYKGRLWLAFPANADNAQNSSVLIDAVFITDATEGFNAQSTADATSSALTTTNSEVSRINGVVSGHTTQLSNLTASIAGKADTSALNSLTARVEAEEGKSSSQSTSITNLNSSVADALKAVTVSDTRSTNQPPSWYWSNYTRRVVNEFKTQTVIGVGEFFGGTYCNLETKVYYSDPSGGDIIQTATSSVDPSLYVQRRSNGTAAWTAWAQPIKDLRDSLGTKASASAVSTLDTKVENIDGKVTTQASQILTLTSDNTANKNALQVQAKVVDGVKANYMVKMETNGVIGGFGLMQSTGVLGQVSTSFGVNADSFFIGAPVGGKKPFMVTTANQVVDGITYPAGTWINSAIIANATIGSAKIADAAITNAKIADATIESAKIKSIKADKIEIGNPLVGPITPSMVTGTSLTNAANLFNSSPAANASFATYGTGTQSDTSGAETSYIQVDVGSTVSMPEVIFFFRGSAGRKTYIKLKASVDGVNWDYIMGSTSKWETIDDMPPAPGNDYSIVTIQASFSWYGVKPYRYLRLYGNGSSASATNELVAIIGNASGSVTKIGSEGILTGAITADKIKVDNLSAISADLGTIKVGSANIQDAAISSAHIADAAITNAKIGNLSVDTLKIADNAVTIAIGGQGVQSLTAYSYGGKMRVDIGIQSPPRSLPYSAQTMYLRVKRNGTIIRTFAFPSNIKKDNGFDFSYICALPPIIETTGVGNVTYSIEVTDWNGNWTLPSSNGAWTSTSMFSISITEMKK